MRRKTTYVWFGDAVDLVVVAVPFWVVVVVGAGRPAMIALEGAVTEQFGCCALENGSAGLLARRVVFHNRRFGRVG